MTTTETSDYSAIWHRLQAHGVPEEQMRELDDAVNADRMEARREVLSQLVIGIADDGSFPAFEAAIRTSDGQPFTIDECDHRYYARCADFTKGHDAGTDVSARFEALARDSLEHDLGNDECAVAS